MARNTASADSPPPPISPRPIRPLSVSTSTMVRTNRPQWHPLAWRNGASSGTVTVVARISLIFIGVTYSNVLIFAAVSDETLSMYQEPGQGRRGFGFRMPGTADFGFRMSDFGHTKGFSCFLASCACGGFVDAFYLWAGRRRLGA